MLPSNVEAGFDDSESSSDEDLASDNFLRDK